MNFLLTGIFGFEKIKNVDKIYFEFCACSNYFNKINPKINFYRKGLSLFIDMEQINFPSHTAFYRDLHKIKADLVRNIFSQMNWKFNKSGWFFDKQTIFDIKIEEDYWDIAIEIKSTPEPSLASRTLFIEYKSSINEWGKQVDQFFRQIKNKIKIHDKNISYTYGGQKYKSKVLSKDIYFLMSFDTRFNDYKEACKMAGIHLVVLPSELLKKIMESATN